MCQKENIQHGGLKKAQVQLSLWWSGSVRDEVDKRQWEHPSSAWVCFDVSDLSGMWGTT